MTTMKLKQVAFGAASVALTLPVAAFATDVTAGDSMFSQGATDTTAASGLSAVTFGTLLQTFINWSLYIIGGLGVLGFVYAGFLYITAGGDDTKIGEAKKMMTYAIIGIVVALLGLIVATTVNNLLNSSAGSGQVGSF